METARKLLEQARIRAHLKGFQRPLVALQHYNCAASPLINPKVLDLVTIAYNEPNLIVEQHRHLKKYLSDPYTYTVVDNSLDGAARQTIQDWAQKEEVAYIGLPLNPFSGRLPSDSHGLALNWAYEHYLRLRRADYIGFLDHDLWPIDRVSVVPILQTQPAYGHLQERGERWYLWPGFSFFRTDLLEGQHPDFMPCPGLDTGGSNWGGIFCTLDHSSWRFPVERRIKVNDTESAQTNLIQQLDGWQHLINGSNWAEPEAVKKVSREHRR